MRHQIRKLGHLNTVIIITLLSIAFSVAFTRAVIFLTEAEADKGLSNGMSMFIAIAIPLLVTPMVSWALIGLILKIDRLEEEMRSLARIDFLTGLLSRQAFFNDFKSYITLSMREPIVFSVLVIDLDKFKDINDKYGHPAGDEILKDFSTRINTTIRKSDLVGRIGGEEFAIMLPDTTVDKAYQLSERLHSVIRESSVIYEDSPIKYTVSIGLVSSSSFASEKIECIENILKQADKALYQAKEKGRNCTAIFNTNKKEMVLDGYNNL